MCGGGAHGTGTASGRREASCVRSPPVPLLCNNSRRELHARRESGHADIKACMQNAGLCFPKRPTLAFHLSDSRTTWKPALQAEGRERMQLCMAGPCTAAAPAVLGALASMPAACALQSPEPCMLRLPPDTTPAPAPHLTGLPLAAGT